MAILTRFVWEKAALLQRFPTARQRNAANAFDLIGMASPNFHQNKHLVADAITSFSWFLLLLRNQI
jgi:hypothetical protein